MLKINKLIIVSGLSRSGKSTLITKLTNNQLPTLNEGLGIDEISSYRVLYAKEVSQLNHEINNVIIHYDMFSRYSTQLGFENLENLINNSKEVQVITICASPKTLIERNDTSLRNSLELLHFNSKHPPLEKQLPLINEIRNRMIIQSYYKDKTSIPQIYTSWFTFFNQNSAHQHWLVDSMKPESPITCPKDIEEALSFIETT